MPQFDHSKKKPDDDGDELVIPEAWNEPRCHVCTSEYRRAIDRMIALGTHYTEISRVFGGVIDRRSISNHAKKHLGYEEAAIRTIIEREAKIAEEDAEEGVSAAVMRRVYLNTALQKAFQALVKDEVTVEPKDAVNVIDALNRADLHTEGTQLDEIKLQFNAFLQAIREISAARGDPNLGADILDRARELVGIQRTEVPQLPA